jgi:hypothetical protein
MVRNHEVEWVGAIIRYLNEEHPIIRQQSTELLKKLERFWNVF